MRLSKAAALCLIWAVLISGAFGATWLKPSKSGKMGRLLGGKTEWTYHEVDGKNPISWKVEGPRTVKVYARIPNGGKGEFTIYIDGDKYKEIKIDRKKSAKYTISIADGKPRPVSTAHTVKLKLAKGEHVIKVVSKDRLFVRMVSLTKKSTAIAPASYEKSLSLVAGDSKTTYYSATKDKPIVFKYDGSGALTVWTRLAFSKSMKGMQHYTVVVSENGRKDRRMKMETVISETSSWVNDGGVIPGKARTFAIKLEKGEHTVEFKLDDTGAPYCAVRFLITR